MTVPGVVEVNVGMRQGDIGYRSFLLRLWCAKHKGKYTCRASLEDPRSGQKHFFTKLEALHEFLLKLSDILEGEVEEKDG
ncbi:MAG TPA: hypothetical protein VLD65_13820 [Anaerolineales bacterium]|nr:hypothetical protein [Anaerolineales bacterium]